MPKLKCRCSNLIDLTPIPCEQKYWLVHDKGTHDLYGTEKTTGDDLLRELLNDAAQLFKCEQCGRLLVFWTSDQNKASVFKLDDGH